MSKRKNRNQSPNIPQSTLDRARQQLGEPVNEASSDVEPVEETPVVQFKETARPAVERRPRTTASRSGAPGTRAPRKEEKHDMAYIRNRLAHPTRVVTEAQLKEEYGYVIRDLRSMGVLAALLIAALVVIEKIV